VVAVVVTLVDGTVGVLVFVFVERVDFRTRIEGAGVVDHDPHHELHAPLVQLSHQSVQVLCRPEVRVDRIEVLGPEAMVAVGEISHHRAHPHCVESHALNLVQLRLQPLEGAPTLFRQVSTIRQIWIIESVG